MRVAEYEYYIISKILNKSKMEFHLIRRLFDDKQIVNPINPEEVFTCKDLVDGNHFIKITAINLTRLQGLPEREKVLDSEKLQIATLLRI